MNEKIVVLALALVALLGLAATPWAAVHRDSGARSTLLLLPDRTVDFTGRTDPVPAPFALPTLLLVGGGLVALGGATALGDRRRRGVLLVAGALVVAVTAASQAALLDEVADARRAAFLQEVRDAAADPNPRQDAAALARVADEAPERSLEASIEAARAAGLNVRLPRLPYGNAGPGPAAFLAVVAGLAGILAGLRLWRAADRGLERAGRAVAVPAVSILLALFAAAVVILLLQPTPMREGAPPGVPAWFAGRVDTLWHAYLTLFADSLGTFGGFADSLAFATPLIFTGLGVAFGFQAGLFNIGAPGQMVLGAIAAMLVGLYAPGPKILVLPLAVAGAAVGGGLWGALAGWLKARFGANEVITTIMLNFIAAALMLFLLSPSNVFSAPAWRVLQFLGVVVLALALVGLVPASRRLLGARPRVSFAAVSVLVLSGMAAVAWSAQGEAPVDLRLPFKRPGSELQSYPLNESARIPQLPATLGIDLATSPGVNVVQVDAALPFALLGALLAFALAPRVGARRRGPRLAAAAVAAALLYGLGAALGWRSTDLAVEPTNLNWAFLIAIGAAVFMQVFLWRTKWGFELRAVGLSPEAAEYGGASIARNVVLAMAISGAFAGLTATHYVLGGALEAYSLRQSLPTGDGFDGIAVALLGANQPLGIVLSAFLFGVLKNGGSVLNITFTDLTRDVVNMILALVVLFIAAKGFLPRAFTDPLRRASARAGEDPTVSDPLDPPGAPARSATPAGRAVREERAERANGGEE